MISSRVYTFTAILHVRIAVLEGHFWLRVPQLAVQS